MTVVIIALTLLFAGIILTIIGRGWLTIQGFRYSPAMGIGVLLFDPILLYFGFYKTEREGKEWWLASWMAGNALVLMAVIGFMGPIQDGLSGEAWTAEYAAANQEGPVNSIVKKKTTPTASDDSAEETKKEETKPAEEAKPAEGGDATKTEAPAADGAPPAADGAKAPAADGAAPAADGAKAPAADGAKAPAADGAKAPAADGAKPPAAPAK